MTTHTSVTHLQEVHSPTARPRETQVGSGQAEKTELTPFSSVTSLRKLSTDSRRAHTTHTPSEPGHSPEQGRQGPAPESTVSRKSACLPYLTCTNPPGLSLSRKGEAHSKARE